MGPVKENCKISTIEINATVKATLKLVSPWAKIHYQDQKATPHEIELNLNSEKIFEIEMNEGDYIKISEGK